MCRIDTGGIVIARGIEGAASSAAVTVAMEARQIVSKEVVEAIEVLGVNLNVVVPGTHNPQRINRSGQRFVDLVTMHYIDHLIFDAVDHECGRLNATSLVDAGRRTRGTKLTAQRPKSQVDVARSSLCNSDFSGRCYLSALMRPESGRNRCAGLIQPGFSSEGTVQPKQSLKLYSEITRHCLIPKFDTWSSAPACQDVFFQFDQITDGCVLHEFINGSCLTVIDNENIDKTHIARSTNQYWKTRNDTMMTACDNS